MAELCAFLGVSSFVDKTGRTRWRFRKKGYPTRMLQRAPGTEGFEQEYQDCFKPLKRPARKPRQAAKIRKTPPSDRTPGFVYFISYKGGPIKIGFSSDPEQRLRTIAKHHHHELEILAQTPGTPLTEYLLHKRWWHLRIKGEWFERDPELMREVRFYRENGKLCHQIAK